MLWDAIHFLHLSVTGLDSTTCQVASLPAIQEAAFFDPGNWDSWSASGFTSPRSSHGAIRAAALKSLILGNPELLQGGLSYELGVAVIDPAFSHQLMNQLFSNSQVFLVKLNHVRNPNVSCEK
jgi:hypothetical protein